MPMIVKYVGPRRGGISQIGSTPVQVPWNVPVELPDELAEPMLSQYPDDWEQVDTAQPNKPKPTRSAKAAPATDESPAGEEVHLS